MGTTKPRKTVNVDAVTAAALVELARIDGRSFSNYAARILREHAAAMNPGAYVGEGPTDEDLPSDAGNAALKKTPPPSGVYPERKRGHGRDASGG